MTHCNQILPGEQTKNWNHAVIPQPDGGKSLTIHMHSFRYNVNVNVNLYSASSQKNNAFNNPLNIGVWRTDRRTHGRICHNNIAR